MPLSRREILKGAGAVGILGALGTPTAVFADETTVRWDIISVDFAAGTVAAGGVASALANDGSKITLTGSGTFQPDEEGDVTGRGAWKTSAALALKAGAGLIE